MPELCTGKIEVVLHGGDGVVRHKRQSVLIPNTVAGDEITYQITEKKRGVLRGKLMEVITPSENRISPPCPVFQNCGGCALQPMHTQAQAATKTTWVTDAFKKYISETTEIMPIQPQSNPKNDTYTGRRRVRWFMQKGKLGFRKRFSHEMVHTETCMALTETLDNLRNTLELMKLAESIVSIQAVELSSGTHIILESEQACPTDFKPEHTGFQQWWWRTLGSPSIQALHKPMLTLFDSIDLKPWLDSSLDIEIGANDFVQGHAAGNQALISQVLEWSEGSKRVVDLFSGCGNLSLPIAKALGADLKGVEITGAELNPTSVKAANNNAKRLGLNASYETMDLFGKFNTESFIAADTLILDPPRKGAKRISQHINTLFPKQIIMVNCDVAAGARDAQALKDAGFKLKALRPLDLFPFAGHVEALSLWTS